MNLKTKSNYHWGIDHHWWSVTDHWTIEHHANNKCCLISENIWYGVRIHFSLHSKPLSIRIVQSGQRNSFLWWDREASSLGLPLLLLALLLLLADFLCLTEGIHHSFLPTAPPLLFPSSHGYIYHPQPILAWSWHRNMLLCCNTSVTPRSPQDECVSMYRLKNCLQSPNSMKGKQLNPANYFWTILYLNVNFYFHFKVLLHFLLQSPNSTKKLISANYCWASLLQTLLKLWRPLLT